MNGGEPGFKEGTTMESLLESLPGVKMSVEEVPRALGHMWDELSTSDQHGPSDFRASQMNLILHFGLQTTVAEAREKFDQVVSFAQRYPCRIIVLCPVESANTEALMEGKLFSQCYLGKNLRDLCCCEALILGYSVTESGFLESQVSLWLESDLPVYHWFHRVPRERIERHYQSFIKRCRRVVWDSSVDGEAFGETNWIDQVEARDLVWARSLPFRQHLGQWLSRTDPEILVCGLKSVRLHARGSAVALGRVLFQWQKARLESCAVHLGGEFKVDWRFDKDCSESASLELSWDYENPEHNLELRIDADSSRGEIIGSWGEGPLHHVFHLDPMPEDKAIAEALFFS